VQINVSARHGSLSPASQSKIATKVSRLKRYFDRLTSLEVTVDLQDRDLPAVELWRSVDGAVQKMEQQLRKHKEKVRDHKHVQSHRHA
jgi:putative sigma-54 modulation protein